MSLLGKFKEAAERIAGFGNELAEELESHVGSARALCKMSDLAGLLRAQRLEVAVHGNGSASMQPTHQGHMPIYTDKILQGRFHYKSFAVQKACTAIFREGMPEIAEAVSKSYMDAKQRSATVPTLMTSMGAAARQSCERVRACQAEKRLRLNEY
eukprot:TRINITY_DN12636_c0_g1_i1.p1 TRINITY_DN12636_c0_g1~~TRINITY_DN12636_c0_g1_i1.p1  ORF type:complete len:155 (+),score=20.55 TRINITY_DN12636_c0_g1_i1:204-668(+)